MGPTLAIAFGAGLASALLFSTLASGSVMALVLFYFAALPVLIAGLGWGHYAGAFAATIGALALSLAFKSQFGIFFFFSVGLPAWVLTYAALSLRPAPTQEDPQAVEWVPPGLLLTMIGGGAVILTLFAIVALYGLDFEAFQAAIRQAVGRTLAQVRVGNADRDTLVILMAAAVPVAAAVVWTFVTTVNLYVAGRIVRASGRLVRPWPDLPTLKLPKWTAVALFVGSVGSFATGFPGQLAAIVLAVGLAVYALQGFALAHDVTRGWGMRGFALGLLYALTFVIGWPMIFVALAGLADVLFDIRARRKPPLPPFNI
ncbi:MAG: hypothetical protein FD152_1248 [Xanthobacteraceae bacterium]|nr:MAG: hypothetical protein FD152_1248 [Xanthobacteraceae bacterium]